MVQGKYNLITTGFFGFKPESWETRNNTSPLPYLRVQFPTLPRVGALFLNDYEDRYQTVVTTTHTNSKDLLNGLSACKGDNAKFRGSNNGTSI